MFSETLTIYFTLNSLGIICNTTYYVDSLTSTILFIPRNCLNFYNSLINVVLISCFSLFKSITL